MAHVLVVSTLFASLLFILVRSSPLHTGISRELRKKTARVVNGQPVTDKNEFPFVVDLSAHDEEISSSRFCTGTLVKPDIVLTAAHCVLNEGYSSPVYATIGRIELDDKHKDNVHAETFRTIASMVHPKYAGLGSPQDVALMLLNTSSTGQLVQLSDSTPNENEETWLVGYGIQKIGTLEESGQNVEVMSSRLQKTALRIKDKAFCDIPTVGLRTSEGMLCTEGIKEGSSACKGDSGGGLFRHKNDKKSRTTVQVGVVSYGDSHCMSEDSGVFTDVASVRGWIEESAKKLEKAFHPDDINLEDGDKSAVVREGLITSVESRSRFVLTGNKKHKHVKFYRIRTNFKKNKRLTISLCDGPKDANIQLHMTSDVNSLIVGGNESCAGGKLSKLSFTAKKGRFVVGISAQEAVPFKMNVKID